MNTAKPLDGRRIVITRAVEQARDLKERLESLGAIGLLLPAVSFSEPSDVQNLDRAIQDLDTFDWILFTSANAVRFFAARCRKMGVMHGQKLAADCAAVGPATASVAEGEGFTIVYLAREFVGTALARELASSLAGKKVLLPRSDRAGKNLPEALHAAGATVTEVIAYHTGGIGDVEGGVMDAVRNARVDVISFFSPSAVENLRDELGADLLSKLGEKAAFAAVGPVTATALRKAGLRVAIEAPEATADSMTASIVDYFSSPAISQVRSS